jgi:hypothetical protein
LRGLNNTYDYPLELEELAVVPLAGGIMQHGYQCGMLWGAALAAGARSCRINGTGAQAERMAIIAAQNLVGAFRKENQYINCSDITPINKDSKAWEMTVYFLLKGGIVGCIRKVGKYIQEAFHQMEHSFSIVPSRFEESDSPLSCTSLLAQKMGVSDLHVVMVSGLAGGIGLCGGACGALGTAIWLTGLKILQERPDTSLEKDETFSKKTNELIATFLKITDYEFECSEITQKQFENANDHAAFLKEGYCIKLLETLAAV